VDLYRTGSARSLRQAKRLAALPAVAHVYAQKSLSRRGRCVDSTPSEPCREAGAGLSRVEANTSSARPSLRPFARRYRIFTCPLPQVRCTGPWAMRPWFPRRRALFQSIPEAASYARRRLSLAGRATASRHPARPSQRSVHLADLRMAIRPLRRRQCPPYTGVEAGATVYLLFSSTAPGSYRWPRPYTPVWRGLLAAPSLWEQNELGRLPLQVWRPPRSRA
jgi:hypothetical protein